MASYKATELSYLATQPSFLATEQSYLATTQSYLATELSYLAAARSRVRDGLNRQLSQKLINRWDSHEEIDRWAEGMIEM